MYSVDNPPASWAPWICEACSRGWWDAELTPEARTLWIGEELGGWDWTNPEILIVMSDRDSAISAAIEAEQQAQQEQQTQGISEGGLP